MKKIGNDGFAITGILYTLFALFLMVLFSVLAGLSSRKNMLEKTTSALNESYVGKEIVIDVLNVHTLATEGAPVTGKYIFEHTFKEEGKDPMLIKCSSYLKKGDDITEITFVPNTCNISSYIICLKNENVCLSSGELNVSENKFILTDIYSFE